RTSSVASLNGRRRHQQRPAQRNRPRLTSNRSTHCRDLPQHGGYDQAMKRQDDCEVGPISRLKASTNWAPAKSWPESTVGGTSRTFTMLQPAYQQPKPQDQKDCVDRGAAGQSDPDPDGTEPRRECEGVGAGKSDHPIADRGEQQRYPCVVHATKRSDNDGLHGVGDKERRANHKQCCGQFDGSARVAGCFAEESP